MPLPLRVVGTSMASPMVDPRKKYTSGKFTCSHLLARRLPLVVKCLVAYLVCKWTMSIYTTLTVVLNLGQQKEEVVISSVSPYRIF